MNPISSARCGWWTHQYGRSREGGKVVVWVRLSRIYMERTCEPYFQISALLWRIYVHPFAENRTRRAGLRGAPFHRRNGECWLPPPVSFSCFPISLDPSPDLTKKGTYGTWTCMCLRSTHGPQPIRANPHSIWMFCSDHDWSGLTLLFKDRRGNSVLLRDFGRGICLSDPRSVDAPRNLYGHDPWGWHS